jgi:hypothetical protein
LVLQAAPANLLRAVWRRLFTGLTGKGAFAEYGGVGTARVFNQGQGERDIHGIFAGGNHGIGQGHDISILDMFGLLNLSLRTMEFEGTEENLDLDSTGHSRESAEMWRREFILTLNKDHDTKRGRRNSTESDNNGIGPDKKMYPSSVSRQWQAHDATMALVNTCHQIGEEMHERLDSSAEGRTFLNPAKHRQPLPSGSPDTEIGLLSLPDIIVFVRGAGSVYLHALALRESDITIVRTFRVAAELVNMFGIKHFLEAVGETLQHWMRVISLHCGARRAIVRVEATDFLELILRSTWDCYGSFFRVRVPLLAVQTEVMERIVATAAARYYRDQRREGTESESFSIVNAEASLVPLWRTLDRIEKQPASNNIAFRGALIRMAEKLKILYRAYVAARVLSFLQGSSRNAKPASAEETTRGPHGYEAQLRARRISVLRVINASDGYSKQFLGGQGPTQSKKNLVHYEAIEDALIDAADVFSPTELPEHRVGTYTRQSLGER